MTRHGGGPAKPRPNPGQHTEYRPVVVEALPPGFRHYALRGRNRPAATGDRQAIAERAARLAERMAAPADGTHGAIHDNPFMPSGYTYLLQFIAHDMVSTRVPFWATSVLDQETANDRVSRLRLEALYGGGPTGSPILYAPADPDDLSRTKLRIGRSGPVRVEGSATVCPFRDIARLKGPELPGLTEPLLADPRNDDHPLISQLTMIFSHLHNIFVDRQKTVPTDAANLDFARDTARVFANARQATTLVYRRVVRDDLLRRLLHPAVYDLYTNGTPPFLDALAGARRGGVPVEFSHGAFRFGHAMMCDAYRINHETAPEGRNLSEGMEQFSSAANIHMEPMDAAWLIAWSNFFDIPGVTDPDRINLSRRIGPWIPEALWGNRFGPIDPSPGRGIFYRDLISAEVANLWPVQDLLAAMGGHDGLAAIVGGSAFLRDDAWRTEIASWLPGGSLDDWPSPWDGMPAQVRDDEIAAIAADPPLPFFILFEALKDSESQGCRLGRFGSVLVADTLFGELNTWPAEEQRGQTLPYQLSAVHAGFADPAFNDPVTMATVIEFIERNLQQSDDPGMRNPSLL